jgi:hypothetical protein
LNLSAIPKGTWFFTFFFITTKIPVIFKELHLFYFEFQIHCLFSVVKIFQKLETLPAPPVSTLLPPGAHAERAAPPGAASR